MNNKNKTRLGSFSKVITHRGKKIKTSVGDSEYERVYSGQNNNRLRGYSPGQVPAGYAARPDLISNLFYESSLSWWRFCEDNLVFDVFEDLKTGRYIYLP